MNLSNNKILITGGATGIGLGLTERFIKENNTVIICGRRAAALNEVSIAGVLNLSKIYFKDYCSFFLLVLALSSTWVGHGTNLELLYS